MVKSLLKTSNLKINFCIEDWVFKLPNIFGGIKNIKNQTVGPGADLIHT
jgi:hypothetical protein